MVEAFVGRSRMIIRSTFFLFYTCTVNVFLLLLSSRPKFSLTVRRDDRANIIVGVGGGVSCLPLPSFPDSLIRRFISNFSAKSWRFSEVERTVRFSPQSWLVTSVIGSAGIHIRCLLCVTAYDPQALTLPPCGPFSR